MPSPFSKFALPKAVQKILKQRFLLYGESPALYDELLLEFAEAIEPRDSIEGLLIKDFIDNQYEILRWRGHQNNSLKERQIEELASRLVPYEKKMVTPEPLTLRLGNEPYEATTGRPPISERNLLAKQCLEGDPFAKRKVALQLADRNLDYDPESMIGATFGGQIDFLTSVSAEIGRLEARRDRLLRTLERYRSARAVFHPVPNKQPARHKKSKRPKTKSSKTRLSSQLKARVA